MRFTLGAAVRRVMRRRPAVLPQVEQLGDRRLPSFTGAALSFDAGTAPTSVAVGDFNGDGVPDLAVADSGDFNTNNGAGVSVLLGNGDGTFQPARAFAAGKHPVSVAAGDFNGDGIPDLAVANEGSYPNYSDSSMSVLLGNGDGSFQTARTLATGNKAAAVVVGDFTGDGILDLAVANENSNDVSVFLGNGDGSFQTARRFAAGANPAALAVADFNRDGIPDLAVANLIPFSGTVSILAGNGDGSFQSPVQFAVGFAPDAVAVGDFNGDGLPDLAVANSAAFGGTPSVSVLVGHGDGTFQTASTVRVGQVPTSVAVGDFNGDGIPDLAVATEIDNIVGVLVGNGDGTFRPPQNVPVGYSDTGPAAVAVGDFTGDGVLDLAVANSSDNSVSVVLGHGDATFQEAPTYAAGAHPFSITVGDFNGDGISDLAVTDDRPSGTVNVLLGNGDGSFRRPVSYYAGYKPDTLVVGDFNGDGILDLAVANYNYPVGTVSVLLGNGDGSFRPPAMYTVGIEPTSLAVADFNGDGHLDLVAANGLEVDVLLGNGDGSFRPYTTYAAGNHPFFVAVGDFNGDGIPDIVASDQGDGQSNGTGLSVLLGNGDGSFQAPHSLAFGSVPGSVAVADFNGDGIADLALPIGHEMGVLLGNGDGTFQPPRMFPTGGFFGPYNVAVGDFNGDGIQDLAVTDGGGVKVLLGNGDGTFQRSPVSYLAGDSPHALAAADFNGDGKQDVAVANLFSDDVSILLNDGLWSVGPGTGPARHPSVPGGDPVAGLAVRPAAPEPGAVSPAPAVTPEQPPVPLRRWLREVEWGATAPPGGTSTPAPRVCARSARDAVFARWRDPLEDLLVISPRPQDPL